MAIIPAALPRAVRELGARLGAAASPHSSVRLTQRGTLRGRPDGRLLRFTAVEAFELQRLAFEWRASLGPLGCVSVRDSLEEDMAILDLRIFRLRIAGVRGEAAATKGEIMRYLAELAWAPDAILHNDRLLWHILDERRLRVSAAGVELQLDEEGRICRVSAPDRPRQEGRKFVERPWHGFFFDYRRHEGRWLPFAGEVGWTIGGRSFIAWRGEILSWQIA